MRWISSIGSLPARSKAHRQVAEIFSRNEQAPEARPYQAAMSMLNFHINRSGKNLSQERRRVLDQAKVELRRMFGRG
jgi:hypothetical protein